MPAWGGPQALACALNIWRHLHGRGLDWSHVVGLRLSHFGFECLQGSLHVFVRSGLYVCWRVDSEAR